MEVDYFKIDKKFVNEHMLNSPYLYSIIYIFLHCNKQDDFTKINITEFSEKTKIMETDIVNALKYFSNKNLIEVKRDLENNTSIKFLSLNNTSLNSPSKIIENKEFSTKKIKYTTDEIILYKKDNIQLKNLFMKIEKITGDLLKTSELEIVFWFYDGLKLPFDVIIFLFEYCVDNKKNHFSYIEKTAIDWAKKNITTKEEAKTYINKYNNGYKEILKALNLPPTPGPAQIAFMDKWLLELNMPLEIILEAADITLIQTGKGNFLYCNKIIESWKNADISTIESLKEHLKQSKDKKESIKKSKKSKNTKNPKSYGNGREWNYAEIENNAIKKLKSIVGD